MTSWGLRWFALIAAAFASQLACGGAVERDREPPQTRQLPGAGSSVMADGGAGAAFEDATEVWVGEVYPRATYPDTFADTTEGVVLILTTTEAGLSGTITFGEDPVPEMDPDAFYPP